MTDDPDTACHMTDAEYDAAVLRLEAERLKTNPEWRGPFDELPSET